MGDQFVDPGQPQASRQPHHEFAPERWFTQRGNSSIWMTAHRVHRLKDPDLPSQPRVVDFKHVRAVLHIGDLRYTDFRAARLVVHDDGQLVVDTEAVKEITSPVGAYWVLMTPFKIDGADGDEGTARDRIAEVVGLLGAFERRNAVFELLFESTYDFGSETTYGSSPSFGNPSGWPVPDLSTTRLQQVVDAEGSMAKLPESVQYRIRLSLRWAFEAMYTDGVDALLKYWVALETLAMPDDTDIKPLIQLLADAHGTGLNEARDALGIGRLCGLRSRIVHKGLHATIAGELIDHVANLYGDAVAQALGAPAMRTALPSVQAARSLLSALGC